MKNFVIRFLISNFHKSEMYQLNYSESICKTCFIQYVNILILLKNLQDNLTQQSYCTFSKYVVEYMGYVIL